MGYDLRTIRQEFKDRGIYHTPPDLAQLLRAYAPATPRRVYDPTCGTGNLLSVFADDVEKYGQELSSRQLQVAIASLANFTGYAGDTLKDPAFLGMTFDCIVANPPFSIAWEPVVDERFAASPTVPSKSRADFAFLLHILHYLAPDGVAVVLCFPGILYRKGREGTIRKWMVEQGYIEKVIHVPGKTFADTSIATACLVMRKGRESRDIEFTDLETGKSHTATLTEIASNDYLLSTSTYVQEELQRVEVDPIDLEHQAQRDMLRKLKADIEISRFVCEMEGLDFGRYLDAIESIVRDARKSGTTVTKSSVGNRIGNSPMIAAKRLAQSVLPLAIAD